VVNTTQSQPEIEAAAQQLTWLVQVRTNLVITSARAIQTQLSSADFDVDPELALDVAVKIVNSILYDQAIAPVIPDYAIALGEEPPNAAK